MGLIAQSSIDEVVAGSDIVEVIGQYFPLRRTGAIFRALCPFHTEKTASFTVNPGRQTYHCFGCGASGGVIRFVQEYEHVDFPTAVRRLAERAGISLQEEAGNSDQGRERSLRARLLELHHMATDWFHERLMRSREAQPARDYLKQRGIDGRIATDWKLGYAPDSWDALLTAVQEAGFAEAEIARSGLFSSNERGRTFDRFRDRILFPIRNEFGETIAFSGRILTPRDDTGKYINSPETPLFSKGSVFFGLDKSKRALVSAGEAIVCEGQIDLISAYEAGVQNVIAPQGTAFTPKQARILKRFVSRVIMCFDADAAGLKAVERSLPALLSYDLEVVVAAMPEGEDPDSTLRKYGVEEFRSRLAKARDFFQLTVEQARSNNTLSTPAAVARMAQRLGRLIGHTADPVYADKLTEQVAASLGIRASALRQHFGSSEPEPAAEDSPESPLALRPEIDRGVRLLASIALASSDAREILRGTDISSLSLSLFESRLLAAVAEAELEDGNPTSASRFLASQPEDLQSLLAGLDEIPPREDLGRTAEDCLNGLRLQNLRRQQEAAKQRLRTQNLPPAEVVAVQKEILDLQRRLADIPRLSRRADAR